MIGARDLAFSQDQSVELVSFGNRRIFSPCFAMLSGGVDTGWTFLHALQHYFIRTHMYRDRRSGSSFPDSLFDPHRAELHSHGASHASAGHDLVQDAAVRVGPLRHQRDPGAGHAGGSVTIVLSPASACSTSASSIRRSRRPRALPASFLVLLAPAVYIMVLPAMGVISELVSVFSRKRVYGYDFVRFPA